MFIQNGEIFPPLPSPIPSPGLPSPLIFPPPFSCFREGEETEGEGGEIVGVERKRGVGERGAVW